MLVALSFTAWKDSGPAAGLWQAWQGSLGLKRTEHIHLRAPRTSAIRRCTPCRLWCTMYCIAA